MSDGDDERDNLDENDPHRALGDIIFDDYKLQPEQDQVTQLRFAQVKTLPSYFSFCDFLKKTSRREL